MLAAFGDDFASVIMAVLYAYDPEIIVLGGSVTKAYPFYEKRMREKLKTFHFQNSLKKLVITQTKSPISPCLPQPRFVSTTNKNCGTVSRPGPMECGLTNPARAGRQQR